MARSDEIAAYSALLGPSYPLLDGNASEVVLGDGTLGDAGAGTGDMVGSQNLSELTDAAAARSNLGLGSAATADVPSPVAITIAGSAPTLPDPSNGTWEFDAGSYAFGLGSELVTVSGYAITGASSNLISWMTSLGAETDVTISGVVAADSQISIPVNARFLDMPDLVVLADGMVVGSSCQVLRLPALHYLVHGTVFNLSSASALTEIDLSGLEVIFAGASLNATSAGLVSLDLSSLATMNNTTTLSVVGTSNLTSVDLPALTTMGDGAFLDVESNDSLTSLDLSALTAIGDAAKFYVISNISLTLLDLSSLLTTGVATELNVSSNTSLTSLDLSALTAIGGTATLNVGSNESLTSLDLSAFTTLAAAAALNVSSNTVLTSLDLSALATVNNTASFTISGNSNLTSLSLSALTIIGDAATFYVLNNDSLTSLDFSALATMGDGAVLFVPGNNSLTTLTLPALTTLGSNTTFTFSGNALTVEAVNSILTTLDAASGSNLPGTVDLSGGTNEAPTGAGADAVISLRDTKGWSVTVNTP